MDFENSLRRSKIETPRYEFKQGFLDLDENRKFNIELIKKLAQTSCGIANIGPYSEGFIHIGVADHEKDADKIKKMDSIKPIQINNKWVVGIDREVEHRSTTMEKYVDLFISKFKKQKTEVSDHLWRCCTQIEGFV